MQKKIIIAIDGYSSCGKSTIAKQIAKKLDYIYIDSGAMYRAVTLYFIRHKINISNKVDVNNALKEIKISFQFDKNLCQSIMFLNNENVEDEIRQMYVAQKVSEVSKIKKVRQVMVKLQQKFGKNKGIVMDGRDIGSVVFPNAELKIFMTADPKIRAKRRYDELLAKGENVVFNNVLENINNRDHIDSNRTESPLTKPADAFVLDNSYLSHEEQLEIVMKLANSKINSGSIEIE